MRSIVRLAIAASLTAVVVPAAFAQANDQGRLYGRVVAMDGSEYQGFIRWANNEGHWTDQLNATKRLPRYPLVTYTMPSLATGDGIAFDVTPSASHTSRPVSKS